MSGASGKGHEKGKASQEGARAKQRVKEQSGGAHDALLALQRTAGNRAVTRLLSGSSGRPLNPSTREEMESKFGEDFGDVRIHDDSAAGTAALLAGARAYTSGRDIVFAEHFYAPQGSEGKRLLAHELAHVVQQGRRDGGPASPAATESEARTAGAKVAAGESATVEASAGTNAQLDPMTEDERKLQSALAPSAPTGELELEPTNYPPAEEVTTRRPRGFEPTGTPVKKRIKAGTLEGLEPTAAKPAPAPRGTSVSREQQGAGLDFRPGSRELPDEELMAMMQKEGVEMPWVGKGPGINSSELGYLRDANKFWKAYQAGPGSSKSPEELAALRASSEHHHVGKGGKTVDLPTDVHKGSSAAIHPSDRPLEQTGKITPASELAGVPESQLRPVDPVTGEWKGPRPVKEPTPEAIAAREQSEAMKPNFKRTKPKGSEIEDFEVREEPTPQEHSTSRWAGQKPSPVEPPSGTAPHASEAAAIDPLPKPAAPTTAEAPLPETSLGAEGASDIGKLTEDAEKLGNVGGKFGKGVKIGGHALGAAGAIWGTYKETKAGIKEGQSTGEALSGALGNTAGGFAASPGAVAANLANTGIQAVGSHLIEKAEREHPNDPAKVKQIKDRVELATGTSQTLTEILPSSTISQGLKAAGRSAWDLSHGDMKAMDKQAEGFERGEAGAPLMGLTMTTDLAASIAGGEDPTHALNRVTKMGENTPTAKAGSYLGDQTYQFVNKDLPEAAEFAKKDLTEMKEKAKEKLSRGWSRIKALTD